MRLSFLQSLALTANSNDGYDLLTESFYRVFSKVINLKSPNANKVTLKSKESKFIGYETKLSGSFEIVNDSLKGGSVSSASFSYRHPSSSVAIEPFPIFSIDEADIRVDDLFASGLSLKNAKSAARKALRGDDHIIGSAADDFLRGYKGNDVIMGERGWTSHMAGEGKTFLFIRVLTMLPT